MPGDEVVNEELVDADLWRYADLSTYGVNELIHIWELLRTSADYIANEPWVQPRMDEIEDLIEDFDRQPDVYWRCHHCEIWNSTPHIGIVESSNLICGCGRTQHWLPGDDA